MTNLSIIDGNYRDGSRAVSRSNDNIQVGATVAGFDDLGNPVYTPKVDVIESLPVTAFGELQVESKTPQVQIKFPYGIVHPDYGQALHAGTGSSVTAADGQATVTCGGVALGFSQIRTVDTLRYGPGQGAEMLGTCVFTTGVANSSQVFGAGDDDEGFFFGYNGTAFGLLKRTGGSLEIKSLTITAGAVTQAGNITVTMDDSDVVIAVANGDTIAKVVAKIVLAVDSFAHAAGGWETHTDDNISVEFISLRAEAATGTFTLTDTGGTGVTANAFTTEVTGIVPTDTWVPQASWNKDTMDGSGPSGMTLDPTLGNVYCIIFQYLGYGHISYGIENSETGRFQIVHTIKYANTATLPTLVDPTLHLTLIAKTEAGYTGGALTMKTGSMAGFIQGHENKAGVRRSIAVEKAMTTDEQPLLIMHNELDFNGKKNKVTVYPDFATVSHDNTSKVLTVRAYGNPTEITGATALTNIQANVSVMQYSIAGTALLGGLEFLSFEVAAGNQVVIDLAKLNVRVRPGDRFVFTGQMQSGSAAVNISGTWVERV